MMIDRRVFVAGTALVAIAPAIEFLPAPLSAPAANASRLLFMIDGWSVASDSADARFGSGWAAHGEPLGDDCPQEPAGDPEIMCETHIMRSEREWIWCRPVGCNELAKFYTLARRKP